MTYDPVSLDPERITDHQRFLTRLARALVRDEHAAEDLVQDAWVAALEEPGVVGRGFLARVLRNRSINRHARAGRRRAREAEVARPEAVERPSPLEELEVQARVLAAVRELPEDLRVALWLRYWHDLGTREIAREIGAPLDTVKSRLARGRSLLRERLERDLGTRERDWCAVLMAALPIVARPATPVPTAGGVASSLGAVLMGTTGKLICASAALAVGAYFFIGRDAHSSREVQHARVNAPADEETPDPPRVDDPAPAERVAQAPAVEQELSSSEAPAATPVEAASLTGLVLDDEAQPVGGVEVVLGKSARIDGVPHARTDASGEFALLVGPDAPRGGQLNVDDPDWVTIGPSLRGTRDCVVLVARPLELAGLVTDEEGNPLAGVALALEPPSGFRSRFPVVLDNTLGYRPTAQSGEDGRFAFAGAARIRGAQLVATHPGYAPKTAPLDAFAHDVALVLRRIGAPAALVEGQVLDDTGRPVEGASVSFGADRVETDAHGVFRLPRATSVARYAQLASSLGHESALLSAVKPGFLPARLEVELDADGSPRWPDGLVLVLAGEALTITGRVLEPDGAPVSGATLWLDGLELFSMEDGGYSIESVLTGISSRQLEFKSDETGAFTIPGLLARDYVVSVLHPATDVLMRTEPIAGGTDGVVLVVDPFAVHPVVSGRVLTRGGLPQAGANVMAMVDANAMRFGGVFVRNSNMMIRHTTTDADGRFELTDVPREHVYLRALGDDIEMTLFPLEDFSERQLQELELHCTGRVHVRLTLDREPPADEFSILDENEVPLPLTAYRGKPGPAMLRAPIHGTVSDTLSVAENASILVLYEAGEEVDRRTIWLVGGEVNEL